MGGKNILALLSAFLTCLIFPKANWFLIAFVALVPLLLEFRKAKGKNLFLKGLLWGFIVQGYFHFWIFSLKAWAPLFAVFLIWLFFSFYLGLFYGVMFWLFGKLRSILYYEWTLPFFWIIFEWLRSLGPLGNSAGSLGYSQTSNLPLLQLASIFGVFGVSFYLVLVNVLIYWLLVKKDKKKIAVSLLIILVLPILWGSVRLMLHQNDGIKQYEVAIIQGNHSENEKRDIKLFNAIKKDYFHLSEVALKDKPDLIFWPETIVSTLNLADQNFITRLLDFTRVHDVGIVLGTPIEKERKIYNAAALVSTNEISDEIYFKNQLMPFGEYIPFRPLLSTFVNLTFLGTDYSRGTEKTLLKYKDLTLGGGICLESIYPWHYRNLTKNGADLLFVLVNNAWFFQSAAAAEHLQMSVLRAVENNRYLIQSGNTGISAIISNTGEVLLKSNLDQTEILSMKVAAIKKNSIYYYLGDILIIFSIILIGFILIVKYKTKKKNKYYKSYVISH
ncbi:MAG: apolipoprotein N-acyltransferase [Candidatus Margulisiibacteriota bacterium]